MPTKLRLNKFLRDCGLGSRRKCERLVAEGRVDVNGSPATEIGTLVDPDLDSVRVDGRKVEPAVTKVYVAAYKPRGVVVTADDPHGRRTIFEVMPDLPKSVFSVGRLDKDSEGLLLLTNDGKLAFRLSHPRNAIERVYEVEVGGEVTGEVLAGLEQGIELEDGLARAKSVDLERVGRVSSRMRLVLTEGRKREIRRMFASCGFEVTSLKRVGFGTVSVSGLEAGTWRYLTPGEIRGLRRLVHEAHLSRKGLHG